jgi:hypothetical protein
MFDRHWRLCIGFVALGFCGCPSIAMPNLLHPGPAAYQRDRAQIFDPYPLPGEFLGDTNQVRPPGFNPPAAEVKRARTLPREEMFSRPNLPNYNPVGSPPPAAPVDTAAAAPVSFY